MMMKLGYSFPGQLTEKLELSTPSDFRLGAAVIVAVGTTSRFWFKCLAEAGPLLRKLIDELERSIKQTSGPELNSIDARRFLFKYIRMTAAIEKELRRLPKSERRYVKTDADGLDMDSLWSIEEQCLREVIKEQTKRAQKDGITVTITNDMVKAKLEEKARQTK